MTNISRTDFPALDGRAVTEAHDRICAERGHARHTLGAGLCPRCGNGAGKCWKSTRVVMRPTPWFATDQHGHIRAHRTWVEALAWANTHEH